MNALPANRLVPMLLALWGCAGCQRATSAAPREPGTRSTQTPAIVEPIFQGGLKGHWEDYGWAPRQQLDGGSEQLSMVNNGGWILTNGRLKGNFGGLVFRFRAPATYGDFLEVRLDPDTAEFFPRVAVLPRHRRALDHDFTEVFIPMEELNPDRGPFARVIVRASGKLPTPGLVEIDGVGLTGTDVVAAMHTVDPLSAPAMPAVFVLDCGAELTPINPLVYGVGFSGDDDLDPLLKPTARRWGGSAASRYNWELGNAWNAGAEGLYRNSEIGTRRGFTWKSLLERDEERQVKTALTVPTLGWVAKDTSSFSFPVAEYGPQERSDEAGAGNGLGRDGAPLKGFPPRTSVAAPPEFIARWIGAIKAFAPKSGVEMYFLDTEPDRWNVVHRDVHPAPVTYEELFERTVAYGTAVRKADRDAVIAGPGFSGWSATQSSPADLAAGPGKRSEREAHGDIALAEWYLDKLAEHDRRTGIKVLDVLDVHYYPSSREIGRGKAGAIDPKTCALRIQSTRSLWDSRYVVEGPDEPVALIPRLQDLVKRSYPRLGISIGEYNFGAEEHMSGGLAVAEALGRFGQEGLTAAFYSATPPAGSPVSYAFRAFRNFDGKGAAFETLSMAHSSDPKTSSLFAARSPDGRRVTLVLLNKSPDGALEASVMLNGCQAPEGQRVFTYVGDARGFVETEALVGRAYRLPPYSMTVVELSLGRVSSGSKAPRGTQ